MKYRVTIEGTEHDVDVQITPAGTVHVSLDGAPIDADVVPIPGGVSLRIDGQVHDVLVGGPAERMTIASGPHRTVARVESERARARRKRAGAPGPSDKEIRSPMPGRVVEVLVAVGDEVAAGQAVVVIEAMKMQNELRAEGAAKVAAVEVTAGQTVEGNAILVRFA